MKWSRTAGMAGGVVAALVLVVTIRIIQVRSRPTEGMVWVGGGRGSDGAQRFPAGPEGGRAAAGPEGGLATPIPGAAGADPALLSATGGTNRAGTEGWSEPGRTGLGVKPPLKPSLLEPPDKDRPREPPSLTGQINSLVAEARRTAGPEAARMGAQLLASTNPTLRVAGIAVLSENDALDDDTLALIARDAELAVSMNALGWLRDTGHAAQANRLAELLRERRIDTATVVGLVGSGTLNSAGGRAVLELLHEQLAQKDARELYAAVGSDESADYAVRMKALLLLRDSMEFVAYRQEVSSLQSAAGADNPLWQEGLSRLATRLQGPVEVHTGQAVFTPSDVDEMLAREYPMMVEDLAQRLEYVTGKTNAYIQAGTARRLTDRIVKLKELPWTEDQQVSLRRLEALAAALPAFELRAQTPPPNYSPPPPGVDDSL